MTEQFANETAQAEVRADETENAAFAARENDLRNVPMSELALADNSYEADFEATVEGWHLTHFKYHEFLFLGGSHGSPGSSCFGLNTLPPRTRWTNFEMTAKVLDELRARLDSAVRLSSIYRNDAYDGCLSGTASESQHKNMRAADFSAASGNPASWRSVLIQMRDEGFFKGGIGIYNTFVHVDTRGTNADWDNRT